MARKASGDKKIAAGDVVVLKSGGPAMTVLSVESDSWVETGWFERSPALAATGDVYGEYRQATFSEGSLKKVWES